MKEQTTINCLEFAKKSREIRGTIAARDLGRLEDVLFSRDEMLDYLLQGGIGTQGKLELRLHVQGALMLVCQRCAGPVRHEVEADARFIIVPEASMMPAPDEEPDDIDYLVNDPQFDIVALIEDEILLGLPMAPLHERSACGVAATGAEEQKESPFKVLQGLKLSKS